MGEMKHEGSLWECRLSQGICGVNCEGRHSFDISGNCVKGNA